MKDLVWNKNDEYKTITRNNQLLQHHVFIYKKKRIQQE